MVNLVTGTTANEGVRTQHPDYTRLLPLWQKCIDADLGEQTVHAAGVTYLPKLKDETTEDYDARVARTPFFNASGRTFGGLKGMVFRKDPEVVLPATAEGFIEDIDQAGTPLNVFAQDIVEKVLIVNRAGVLVDHPSSVPKEGRSVADAELLGLRPKLVTYGALSVINWKTSRVNNVMLTSMVVLVEFVPAEDNDEFAQKTEARYRVLDLDDAGDYRQRVFKISAGGADEQIDDDIYPTMKGKKLKFIPFYFFSADDLSADAEVPPLLDLVNMNFHHYQVSADWEHGCHFQGLPTGFIFGHTTETDNDKIYIGGSAMNAIANPEGHAEYMEVSGNFEALSTNLTEKKAEMAVLGARMLEGQKASVEAAETLQQRSVGETSQLAGMSKIVSMGMTQALKVFAEWGGDSPNEVVYKLNTDFMPVGMTPEALLALLEVVQAGRMSFQTFFENLQRGEVISSKTTIEDEQERIATEQIPPPIEDDA